MPDATPRPAGTFCWMEHDSRNRDAAEAFYRDVLGWEITRQDMGGGYEYAMATVSGLVVGGLWALGDEVPADAPSRWTLHIAVDDADASAARAIDLGATVLMDVHEVMGMGRLVLLQDPAGATIGLWQALSFAGLQLEMAPGSLTWADIAAPDLDAARDFYTALLGWEAEELDGEGRYVVFNREGAPIAGATQHPALAGWTPYIAVLDTDATVAAATAAGATVMWGPADTPYGRIAALTDPAGVAVNVIRPNRQPVEAPTG